MSVDEVTPEEVQDDTPPKPKGVWEKREFAINGRMKEVCRLSAVATEAEIAGLKRKLAKLQYGS
jgi:hypothetical protein